MKRMIGIVLISAVVGVALGALLAWFQQPDRSYRSVPEERIDSITHKTSTGTAASASRDAATGTSADRSAARDRCVEKKRSKAQGKDYQRGTLLVSFNERVPFKKAVQTVEAAGASATTSDAVHRSYKERGWFEVSVPDEELFEVQCTLEEVQEVRGTRLNVTFNLAE